MRVLRSTLLLASLFPVTGCFGALANLDHYEIGGGGDFCWHLLGYTPHAVSAGAMPQSVALRAVDETNQVDAMVIYDPLPTPEVTGTLSGPLNTTSVYKVQIFADLNRDRMLEPYPTDHTWDLVYDDRLVAGCFTFMHGMPFNTPTDTVASRPDDPASGDAIINVASRLAGDGSVLVMRITDTGLMTDVGFYRYLVRPTVDPLPMHDLMAGDTTYKLDAFVDTNDNGTKDAGERAFSDTQISGTAGADVHFMIDLMRPLP